MKSDEPDAVLAVSDAKSAALYFDAVGDLQAEPVGMGGAHLRRLRSLTADLPQRAAFQDLASEYRGAYTLKGAIYAIEDAKGKPIDTSSKYRGKLGTRYGRGPATTQERRLADFLVKSKVPIWGQFDTGQSPARFSPGLALAQANLVDVSSVGWNQIMAFREDPDARASFRKLRRFVRANYAESSANEIKDDLAERMRSYELSARKHGFKLAESSFLAFSAPVATIAAQIFGASLDPAVAAAGMVVGYGAASLQLAWRDAERQAELVPHEARYLVAAKKRLEK